MQVKPITLVEIVQVNLSSKKKQTPLLESAFPVNATLYSTPKIMKIQ